MKTANPITELIERIKYRRNQLILKTDFIPDSEVQYYLCAADAVVQPYRNATQSGVTPLAYHFEKPMIVSNVGSFAEQVLHEKTGLVAEADPASLAKAIIPILRIRRRIFYSSSS